MCTKNQVLFLLCLLTIIGFTTSGDTVYCNNTAGNFTKNDTYGRNRDLILSSLFSKVPANDGFYNGTAGEDPDKVYAIGFCRADFSPDSCSLCMESAVRNIQWDCPNQKEAVAWIGDGPCIVRYASRSFLGILELDTHYAGSNGDKINSNLTQFHLIWGNLTTDLVRRASYETGRKFARAEANLSSVQSIYTLMQCTPDLSESDCFSCLYESLSLFQECCNVSQGGFVQRPNCIWRWDLYRFYELPLNSTRSTPKKGELGIARPGIARPAIIVPIIVLVILAVIACIILQMKKKLKQRANSPKVLLFKLRRGIFGNYLQNKDFHGEKMGIYQEFPSMQLGDIKAATQHFNDANKLGEGGFGPVYKGTLADGRVIAVKRLSRTSGQGLVEFKNEVMLIARLQHKNLVKLLGFFLEKKEKLLVYEFMPNRSLDVFLFDSSKSMKLDWQRRLNIINGLARGIMYLHEDSCLKVIHRDLKASNILLDGKMNPKISDFGMARIFRGSQNEANTKRVVGTYGYMAPEYAKNGLFSTKSDVFSFGVLLLEIISGKKSNGFHHLEEGESLLSYAWKLWCKDEWMKLIDPAIVESCVASEVRKCIHIGLLCVPEVPADRPSMSSVVVMLTSGNIALPKPKEPAFSVRRVGAGIRSFNNVTISDLSPR